MSDVFRLSCMRGANNVTVGAGPLVMLFARGNVQSVVDTASPFEQVAILNVEESTAFIHVWRWESIFRAHVYPLESTCQQTRKQYWVATYTGQHPYTASSTRVLNWNWKDGVLLSCSDVIPATHAVV